MSLGKKASGLGRGLSELLGEIARPEPAPESGGATSANGSRRLPIEIIHPNKTQPRRYFKESALQELEDSIREKGVLQAIMVRPSPSEPGLYEIVAGERRWRAAQRVPLHEMPVVVRDLSDQDVLELALVENIQRQDLNPIEEAESYRRLIAEFGHSQERLGEVVGKSRSHIANLMRLLDLPVDVKALMIDGKLGMGHARALIGVTDAKKIADEIIKNDLSVRQVEALVRAAKTGSVAARPRTGKDSGKDPDTLALERDITSSLGMPVTIIFSGSKGTATIAYASLDELDELCQRLTTPISGR